jgi:tricorn protease
MKKTMLMMIWFLIMGITCSLYALDNARLLHHPDIYGETIVFVYGGDIWKVSSVGGKAQRLTSDKAYENNPIISPDGKWVAFDAAYDGNPDVYIIPINGGIPQRLTFHPVQDNAVGWSPDGKHVVFSSDREHIHWMFRLFKVAVDGSNALPERLPFHKAATGSYSPDGNFYAYNPNSSFIIHSWRRYRGGTQPYIWIYDFKTHHVKKIPHPNSNDINPRWQGKEIFFLSDRDRVMNLFAYDVKTEALKQLTKYTGADIKTFGIHKEKIVFERDGYLHLMDLGAGKTLRLTVNIPAELLNLRPRHEKIAETIFSGAVSPNGKRAVFGARGEIITVPAKKGEARNLTHTPGQMERSPIWSPDGQKIAYFGEKEGEYVLKVVDQKAEKAPIIIKIPNPTFFYNPSWSPDSKKIAFCDLRQDIYYIDINTGTATKVDHEPRSNKSPRPNWSPDSQWLTYAKGTKNTLPAVYIYSLQQKKSFMVTDQLSGGDNPVFDSSGKYLYFTVSTDVAHDLITLDMASIDHHPTSSIYLAVLSNQTPSPFAPVSDEEEKEKRVQKPTGKKGKDKKNNVQQPAIVINLDDLDQRILALDIPAGQYKSLQVGKEGELYYLATFAGSRKPQLHRYDLKTQKDKIILKDVAAYDVAAKASHLLYKSNKESWAIIPTDKKVKPGTGTLKINELEVYSVPTLEYRQMLREVWRFNRDNFYDPGMHGQDWEKIWHQYQDYLPHVASRNDLANLMASMLGEYTCSHVSTGALYPNRTEIPAGLLGADYEISKGLYRIKKIYRGENWNPKMRAPLTGPGKDIKEGEYILAVNGQALKDSINIYLLFHKTADKQVTLKLNNKPSLKGARTITVIPVADEMQLRYRQWLTEQRKQVEKWSNGTVGYIHMPDTHRDGLRNFKRYYFANIQRPAIILDGRNNGGGKVADYVINMLNQKVLSWWQPRNGQPFHTPGGAHRGPKIMLTNELAGSGGDFLPWAFRETGLGKIVGATSWGGLVGVSSTPPLMDGGYFSAPSFGIVDKDGNFIIENEGVKPDYEVPFTPADFISGKDPQLFKAVQLIMEELKKKKPQPFKHNGFPRNK